MRKPIALCGPFALLIAGCVSDDLHQGTIDMIDGLGDDSGDSGCEDTAVVYPDADGDGYGDAAAGLSPCDGDTTGYIADATDCDDAAAAVHPGAADDTCDGLDNDCDLDTDEDAPQTPFYADADADGHGDPAAAQSACVDPDGEGPEWVETSDDCDDGDPARYPGAAEACDGVDTDCGAITLAAPAGPVDLAAYALGGAASGLGWTVAGIGDLTGDGIADIAVGAPGEGGNSGEVRLWFGPVQPGATHDTILLTGSGQAGYALSGGNGAVLAGAPAVDDDEGAAYFFESGTYPTPSATISGGGDKLSLLGEEVALAEGLTKEGGYTFLVTQYLTGVGTGWYVHLLAGETTIESTDDFGVYLGPLGEVPVLLSGDIDGDGDADLAVAGEGTVGVYFGPIVASPSDEDIEFNGANSGSEAGASLAILPQSNTFAIGAPGDDKVYLFTAPKGGGNTYDIDNEAGLTLSGAPGTGSALAVGDWNGDGQEDLAVGAAESATVYVLYGPLPGGDVDLAEAAGATLTGAAGAGWSLADAGDAGGDGCGGLLVGAPDSGAAYLVAGGETVGKTP